MAKVFIGIDPGASGYICALIPESGYAEFLPNTLKPKDILSKLQGLAEYHTVPMIALEEVSSIQGASAGSNFKFGFNYGTVQAVAECSGIGVDLVPPKKWQAEVGVKQVVKKKGSKMTQNQRTKIQKQRVADACDRLYPQVEIRGPKGGLLDGKADSLLIAHYCYLRYK